MRRKFYSDEFPEEKCLQRAKPMRINIYIDEFCKEKPFSENLVKKGHQGEK